MRGRMSHAWLVGVLTTLGACGAPVPAPPPPPPKPVAAAVPAPAAATAPAPTTAAQAAQGPMAPGPKHEP